jgi:hypothetical protein
MDRVVNEPCSVWDGIVVLMIQDSLRFAEEVSARKGGQKATIAFVYILPAFKIDHGREVAYRSASRSADTAPASTSAKRLIGLPPGPSSQPLPILYNVSASSPPLCCVTNSSTPQQFKCLFVPFASGHTPVLITYPSPQPRSLQQHAPRTYTFNGADYGAKPTGGEGEMLGLIRAEEQEKARKADDQLASLLALRKKSRGVKVRLLLLSL